MNSRIHTMLFALLLLCPPGLLVATNQQVYDLLDEEFASDYNNVITEPHDIKTAHKQLDEISSILQYLVQVCNKGGIKAPQSTKAKLWAIELQKTVKLIKRSDELSNDNALKKMAQTTRALCLHIAHTVKTNFEVTASFELPVLDDSAAESPLTFEGKMQAAQDLHQLLNDNGKLIKELNDEAKTAGLTSLNRFVRRVDAVNEQFGITRTLEKLPRAAGVIGMGMYLTPNRFLKDIPGVGYLKSWIGTPNFYDPVGYTEITGVRPPERDPNLPPLPPPPKFTIAGFAKSDDWKSVKHLLILAGGIAAGEVIDHILTPVKTKLRMWWNQLKGFEVPTDSDYKYPDITLADKRLIGLEGQIAEMWNIVQYIIDPETYDRSASGLEKGILLTGPSRSGKTLLSKALCGTLNEELKKRGIIKKFAFRNVKYSDIRWTSDGIKSLIAEAKQNAPCVLFIDEIHNLPLQTKEGGDTLTEFLTMTESLETTDVGEAVILLAATNRAYMLDDALLKPGRFGLKIHFEEPTFEKRKKFFEVMFHENGIDPAEQIEFDIDAIARQTEGSSYGDLDLIFKNARFTARCQRRSIEQNDIIDKIYRQIYRIRFDKQLPLTPEAKKLVAAHQAGHALMHMIYENEIQERLEAVTLQGKWRKIIETRYFDPKIREEHAKKKTKYGHIMTSHKSEAVRIETNPVLTAKVKLAGAVAEKILLGSTNYSYHEKDKRKALDQLEKIALNGLKKEDFSPEEQKEPMMKAKAELVKCEQEVHQLLTAHKADLEKIAHELEHREILTGNNLRELLAKQSN